MRSLSVRVNEHPIRGSSLGVLQGALLREVGYHARRYAAAKSRPTRARHAREYEIARKLARDVGCPPAAISAAGRGVRIILTARRKKERVRDV